MAISDAQYQDWLESDLVDRTLLVEAKYYSGTEQTEYMSTRGHITKPTDSPANTEYEDVIIAFPIFRRSMAEAFNGKTQQSFGDIEIINTDGERDSWLDRSWNGRDVVLKFGDPSWDYADFRTIMSGSIAELTTKSINVLVLKIRDKGIFLEKQFQEAVFASGPSIDKPVPVCYGEVKKIVPVLEDGTTHKYKVHDGAISSIDFVYDQGVSVTFTPDVATGTFTLATQPAGQITADVKGATFAGLAEGAATYFDNIADIVYDIIKNRSDLLLADIDTTNFASFKSSYTQKVGVYVDNKDKFTQVLDKLLSSIGGFWGLSRSGKITLGQLLDPSAGTSVLTVTSDDIVLGGMSVKKRQLPRYRVTLGYQPYQKVQSVTELAGSVTEDAAADLREPHRLAIAEDLSILTTHLLAHESQVIPTLLASSTEAATEASRRLALRNQIRTTYIIDGFTTPFSVEVGDVITVSHSRFGFDGGVKAVVIGYSESITPPRIQLEVWK